MEMLPAVVEKLRRLSPQVNRKHQAKVKASL
jgi:hypothetical protein